MASYFPYVTVTGNAMSHDYFWDFVSGPFPLSVGLDMGNGFDFITKPGAPSTSDPLSCNDTDKPSPSPQLHFSVAATGYVGGPTVTRTNAFGASSQGPLYLYGPYVFSYPTIGAVTANFKLTSFGNPGAGLRGQAFFSFHLWQQAVPVIRQNSSSGSIIVDGAAITMDTGTDKTIILNKSTNRGDDLASNWTIFKQDAITGIFSTAIVTNDYSLGLGETLISDQITLTWISPGVYKVFNNATGSQGTSQGVNTASVVLHITVGITTIDTITLPNVISSVTPVIAYNNTIVTSNPLVGVNPFQVSCVAVIDASAASWVQQIGTNPPITLPMSQAAWSAEILSRCVVTCELKQGGNVLQAINGFGPFTFTVGTGTYDIGFIVVPKSGSTTIYTLAILATR